MINRDPTRAIRNDFEKQYLRALRLGRVEALQSIRQYLMKHPVNVDEITEILKKIQDDYLLSSKSDGYKTLDQFTKITYNQGIKTSMSIIAGKESGISLDLSLSRPDKLAISNLAKLAQEQIHVDNTETLNKIVRALVRGEKQGTSLTRQVTEAQNLWNADINKIQLTIRNLTSQAYNEASWTRTKQYAPFKGWSDAGDMKTRPGHKQMHNIIVEVDDPFEVPGFHPTYMTKSGVKTGKSWVPGCQMMYPRDESMGAVLAQIINCRCAGFPSFSRS